MGSKDVPTPAGSARRLKRLYSGASAVLLALGLALHVSFFATVGPLWRDEAHEVNFASLGTLSDVLGRLWLDSSPALYKLFLRSWSFLGSSDATFRLSGLAIAVIHAGVLFSFFGRPWRRSPPLLVLALPVLSPVVVLQLDALRPYGLGVLLTTLFFSAFLRFFRDRGTRAYGLAAVAGILAVNTTYHACFFVLAACLGGALVELSTGLPWRRALAVLSVGAWPLLGVLPYVGIVERSSTWIVTQQTELPLAAVLGIYRQAAGPVTEVVALAAVAITLVFLIVRIGGTRVASEAEARDGWLGLVTLVLFSSAILGSFYASGIPPTPNRYVPLLVMSALCLDVSLRTQPLPWRVGTGLVLGVLSIVGLPRAIDRVTTRQTNVDLVAERIEHLATQDDLVLLRSWSSAISFCRYYNGSARVWTIPNIEDHSIHRYDLLRLKFEDEDPISDVGGALEDALKGGHRILMVGSFRPVRLSPEIPLLAPAPHPKHDWYKVAYLWNWEDRVTQFVLRHATEIVDATPAPAQDVHRHERLPLHIATGWREPTNAVEGGPTPLRPVTGEAAP